MMNRQPQQVNGPRKGPGLLESMMWVSGYHLAQTVSGALLLLLLILAAFDGLPHHWSDFQELAIQLGQGEIDWLLTSLIGCATLGSLFFVLPLAFWRMSPRPREVLGLQLPSSHQLVLLAGAVVPLGILSDELYRAASLMMAQIQQLLIAQWPVLATFELNMDSISLIHGQTVLTAYPQLLVIVGVGPAIGEEVIFRGVIGRGLIARWGVIRGVLLTSLLFAIAHLSPSHALATLPIAIFLHVAYLATGSLWAPILVHFLNNALSVTMMKYELGQNVQVSMFLLVSSAVYVSAIGILLLRNERSPSRLQWANLTMGQNQRSVMTSAGGAPALAAAPSWLTLIAGTGVLCFTLSFVAAAMAAPTL